MSLTIEWFENTFVVSVRALLESEIISIDLDCSLIAYATANKIACNSAVNIDAAVGTFRYIYLLGMITPNPVPFSTFDPSV